MKIGIIGLGFMGATHLDGFAKLPGVDVAAVCSGNPRALSGDLSQTGGNRAGSARIYDFSAVRKYTRWQELISDAELDAVDICLPTDLHASVTIAALQAGKHVLVEKPMALTVSDCDAMMAAADQSNRILMVGQVLRFWPEYRYLLEFSQSNAYGAIRAVTFIRQGAAPDWSPWLLQDERSGGAVVDLLIHDIDQALLLFGMPTKVAAKRLGDADAVMATFIYPGGPEVRIQGGWFAQGMPFSMTYQARAERAELEFTQAGLTLSDTAGQRLTMTPEGGDAYEAQLRYFVECCRNGEQPRQCMPRESAQAVKVALLLKQSREMGGEQIQCLD
jgi:predicted dehydrogenase